MTKSLSLAGAWRVCLGGAYSADIPPPDQAFVDEIKLPATTETAGLGPLNPDYRTDRLTAVRRIEGPVWYQREINLPADWKEYEVSLFIERTKWCRVWLDGRKVEDNPILCAPHHLSLGGLAPGSHRLTLCVDNARKPAPGDNHQTSEHTQGNWNGLLGLLELRANPKTRIDDIQVVPDVADRSFKVKVWLAAAGNTALDGELSVQVESCNHDGSPHRPAMVRVPLTGHRGDVVEVKLPLGPDGRTWDEFSPALYRLTFTLETGATREERVLVTGLREFRARGTQFAINARTTFLRGEVNCCVFPLTGHPPMEVEGWRHYYRTLLEYGINHVRFHSWTPPDAAFTAADELGIYLQTELPFWGEWNEDVLRALRPEAEAILRTFGHHPSFVIFSLGNEHRGDRSMRARLVAELRQLDPHRLYVEGANNDLETPLLAPADDCWITARVPDPAHAGRYANVRGCFATNDGANGHLQIGHGGTCFDYSAAITGIATPVVSHEIGQFTVSPRFGEITDYTGVFAAHNLGHFRTKAEAAGLLGHADEAFHSSARLAALLYREEIEAALRTSGFGGFQLLGLQDFPGQGTALVGLLDAFMKSKGAITPLDFRRFCSPHVLLARFDRHVWTAGESFSADLDLAHYGPVDLAAGSIDWRLCESGGNKNALVEGRFAVSAIAQGGVRRLGVLQFALPGVAAAKRVDLILRHTVAGVETRYPLWIYPAISLAPNPSQPGVKLVRHFDAVAQAELMSGGRVILMPDAAHPLAHSPGGGFMTDFWCWPLFYNQPGTMGLLIQPEHPALAGFPTETHSDWQWFHLAKAAQPVVLDSLPLTLSPIVRVVDNLDRVHRLGLIFEARVGVGRLLVCGLDLPALAEKHPEARCLLASLLAYVGSEKFAPMESLELAALSRALEAKVPMDGAKLSASTARPNRDPFLVLNANSNGMGGTRPLDGLSSAHDQPARPEAALHPIVGEWWQADFPAPKNFNAIELVWDKCQQDYRVSVEISADGLSWHLLSKIASGEKPLRYHRINAAARDALGVRVRVNGLPTGPAAALSELRLVLPQN